MNDPASNTTGRLVQDIPYYVGLLRHKIALVSNETTKLRNEFDQGKRLENRFETLQKSRTSLEEQLADYNLTVDKVFSF
jgi:chaperonin cofactor prefoldin